MAWSVLQSNSANSTSGSTPGVAFTTANLSSGTVLLCAVSCFNAATTSVTDASSNSFTKIGSVLLGGAEANGETSLWAIATPAGDVGSKPTITAHLDNTSAGVAILIQEVSGIQAVADGTAGTATQASGTNASPSYSSTAVNEYLVAVGGDNGGPETMAQLGSGYSADAKNLNNNATANILVDFKNSGGGAESDGWSSGSVGGCFVGAILVAFKLSAAAAPAAAPAAPGKTWLRRFRHRQVLPPVPAVAAAPASGPPVTPLAGPVRTRPQPPPRGRSASSRGTYAQLGPPVTPLRGPVSARQPLPRRGRCAGSQGAPVSAPPPQGAPAPPLHSPVRTRPQPPPRGRTAGNPGIRQQTGPPVTPLRGPVQARRPLPSRGRCAGNAGTSTVVVITSGSPVYPLRGPVRTRPQPPLRGRCASSPGIRHQAGPPVRALRSPVAPFRPGPFLKGRCAANRGTRAQSGPAVTPLQRPVRARIPQRPRGGHTAANAGAPVFAPQFTIGALTALTASGVNTATDTAGLAAGAPGAQLLDEAAAELLDEALGHLVDETGIEATVGLLTAGTASGATTAATIAGNAAEVFPVQAEDLTEIYDEAGGQIGA